MSGYEDHPVKQTKVNLKTICVISDLHEQWRSMTIPECDLLIVAGDLTYRGDWDKVQDFNNWAFDLQNEQIKAGQRVSGPVGEVIVIAGNHDLLAQKNPRLWQSLLCDVTYLEDELYEWNDLKIYGSPWTPSFYKDSWVFNADRGPEIRRYWDKIPEGLDILITHGPAYGARDLTPRGERVGCHDLRKTILEKKPRIHVCGHIHGGYGLGMLGNTLVMNAASCTEHYKATNPPLVIELEI